MAASLGLEPRQAESESAVLPITPRGTGKGGIRYLFGYGCKPLFPEKFEIITYRAAVSRSPPQGACTRKSMQVAAWGADCGKW